LERREQNLKYAAKFFGVYPRLVEVYYKYRGKGQQKIETEPRVFAIRRTIIDPRVDNVEAGAGDAAGGALSGAGSPALTHDLAPLVPDPDMTSRAKKRERVRLH
jgi:hypothetical protein